MKKDIIFGDDARSRLYTGVNKLATAVRVTMGPSGQNVLIERQGAPPHLTKDGVTVAQAVQLRDKYENLGAQIVKEAAQRTADTAGDGTTTATVLAHSMYTEGLKMIAAGMSATEICRGIEFAARRVEEELRAMSLDVSSDEDVVHVGTISANGDSNIGSLLCKAVRAVGPTGTVTVEDAKGFETFLELTEGTQIDRGYVSPYFVTNQDKMSVEQINPLVFLANKRLTSLKEILPVLEAAHELQRPLLIIADDIEGEAVQGLVVNKLKGSLQVCAIKSPEFGESRVVAMQDLSVMFGAKVYTPADFAMGPPDKDGLGSCKKAVITKHSTIIIADDKRRKDITDRIESLRGSISSSEEPEAIQRSISRLADGIAVIKVGGATEIELKERKDRVDDALCATQAAIADGILPGGGVALLRAATKLESLIGSSTTDFGSGIKIVQTACQEPLRQIVLNTGGAPDLVLGKVRKQKGNKGYDARQQKFVDMLESGIIDPTRVVRSAINNASSAARNLLSVGCAMTFEDDVPDLDQSGLVEVE